MLLNYLRLNNIGKEKSSFMKKYPYYNETIPVNNLILDSKNPRLPLYMHGKDESEIIDYLILQESTLELMQAIGEKGFFLGEQLLVVEKGDDFLVVEGNRRLTAVKLINNPEIAKAQSTIVKRIKEEAKPENQNIPFLPCMIFEKEEDIHDYIGYRHVTGIQPWNLRQKAEYLSFLKNKNFNGLTIEKASNEIRKMIGSKRDYVKRILVGQLIYTRIKDHKFFSIKNLEEENFYFSYIADSLRQPQIVSYLGIDMNAEDPAQNINISHLQNWTTWFYSPIEIKDKVTTRLKGKSQDLNQLNAVLENEEAKKQFIENDAGLSEAFTYTEDFTKTFKNAIENSLFELKRADNLTHKLSYFYSSLDDDLREVISLARKIKGSKDKLGSNEFEGDEF
jgi:hypothetical protein